MQAPDVEDWKKLKRTMKFLEQTIEDSRIIGAESLTKMKTYVDSSHAVHPDMRGHTGGAISFGTGILSHVSSKQKMNSRSTNETEVIGNSEYLPRNIWHDYFFEAQGYKLRENVFFQDNEGAEKMAKNGKLSCSSRSRHINIKFFWITDRVKKGRIQVKHCATDRMVADFFTKPLQGSKFHTFREIIMGWKKITTLEDNDNEVSSIRKEQVGKIKISDKLGIVQTPGARSWSDIVTGKNK